MGGHKKPYHKNDKIIHCALMDAYRKLKNGLWKNYIENHREGGVGLLEHTCCYLNLR